MALREKSELMSMGVGNREAMEPKRKSPCDLRHKGLSFFGGDGGIRTLDTLLAYAPLAGEYLRPLGHISADAFSSASGPATSRKWPCRDGYSGHPDQQRDARHDQRHAEDLARSGGFAEQALGFGGVTALGCSIGQGITGLSTLALGSAITTVAIIAGAALTLKLQYWLMMREA